MCAAVEVSYSLYLIRTMFKENRPILRGEGIFSHVGYATLLLQRGYPYSTRASRKSEVNDFRLPLL